MRKVFTALVFAIVLSSVSVLTSCVYRQPYSVVQSPMGAQMVTVDYQGRTFLMEQALFNQLMNQGGYNSVINHYQKSPNTYQWYDPTSSTFSNWQTVNTQYYEDSWNDNPPSYSNSNNSNSSSFKNNSTNNTNSNTGSTFGGWQSTEPAKKTVSSQDGSSFKSSSPSKTSSGGSSFKSAPSNGSSFKSSPSSGSSFKSSSGSGGSSFKSSSSGGSSFKKKP